MGKIPVGFALPEAPKKVDDLPRCPMCGESNWGGDGSIAGGLRLTHKDTRKALTNNEGIPQELSVMMLGCKSCHFLMLITENPLTKD